MLWDILFRAEPIPPYPSSRMHNSRFMNRAVSVPGVSFHWLKNCWDVASVLGIVWSSLVSLLSSASWNFPGETVAASFCRKNNWIHIPRSMHTVGAFPCFFLWFNWLSILPLSQQWRHNRHDGVTNHRRLDCLLNCLFRCRLKKISNLRITGLC